jgi:streptogramin lyase
VPILGYMATLRRLVPWVIGCLLVLPSAAQAAQTIAEFPVTTADSGPSEVTAGADGNLWFTESSKNKIGRMSTGGVVTEWPAPSGSPQGIALGSDDNIWATEPDRNKVFRVAPDRTMTEFSVSLGKPWNIVSGPGGDLWFTEHGGGGVVGHISTTGAVTEYTAGIETDTAGIAFGPDGNVWFTEPTADKIGRITPAGVVTEFGLAAHAQPYAITTGPDGNLWFTEQGNGGAIGTIDLVTQAITEYSTGLTASSKPAGIVTASDGFLYFSETAAGKIGKISDKGIITEFPTAAKDSTPDGVAVGPDGNVWFVESHSPAALGRITLPPELSNTAKSDLTDTSATAGADIGAHGQASQFWVEYGLTTAYGSQTPHRAAGSGDTVATFSTGLTGLAPGTKYHFHVVAANDAGTTWGPDRTFTTAATPPTPPVPAAPSAANALTFNIGRTRADVQADINPNGLLTTFYFAYGLDTGYGSSTLPLPAGLGLLPVTLLDSFPDLTPGTTYHFRVVATNLSGTTFGDDATFTTEPALPVITPGTGVSTTPVTTSDDKTRTSASTPETIVSATGDSAHTSADDTPHPVLTKSAVVAPADGTVKMKEAGARTWSVVNDPTSVPMGAVIDTSHGKLTFETALPSGAVQSAQVWGGQITMRQSASGMVDVYLAGAGPACPRGRSAVASKKQHTKLVWIKDNHGRFRSHGKNSVATVRGTLWLTQETCRGTVTRVKQGKVAVRDLHRKRTVLVRAGHSYLAKRR